jgi:hypothetical protein
LVEFWPEDRKNNNARLVPHMSHEVVLVGSLGVENGKKAIYASSLKMVSK